jgi:hypothetical protein
MKIILKLLAGVGILAVFLLLVWATMVAGKKMEADCQAAHGTFVKSADPALSVCIIPPK